MGQGDERTQSERMPLLGWGETGGVLHSAEQLFLMEDSVGIYHNDQACALAGARIGCLALPQEGLVRFLEVNPAKVGGGVLRLWLLGMLTHKLVHT